MLQIAVTDQISKHNFVAKIQWLKGLLNLAGLCPKPQLATTDVRHRQKQARAVLEKNRKRAQVDMRHLFLKKIRCKAHVISEKRREINIFDDSGVLSSCS